MKDQSGNVTLKTKVDMSQNFTLSGSINLGDKSSESGGADGVRRRRLLGGDDHRHTGVHPHGAGDHSQRLAAVRHAALGR